MTRQLHLNYFHSQTGQHEAAWRHPDSPDRDVLAWPYLVEIARTAEDACLDSVFLPHGMVAAGIAHSDFGSSQDPLIALAAVAARTSRIGLIATMSTTFGQPYDVAQRFATLDHLSGGRAAWNIVTSSTDTEARNFGMLAIPEHDHRYQVADEFVRVVTQLWDSWPDDAWMVDKASGVYADTTKVTPINHRGEHFAVAGPLGLPRCPQGRPMLVQAGASEAGREFAARHADAVFAITPTIEDGIAFFADVKTRARRHGRDPDTVKIMPGLAYVLGATEREARERAQELADLVIPERGLGILGAYLNMDLAGMDLDGPVPELPDPSTFSGGIARFKLLHEHVQREQPTLGQLAGWFANQMRGHGMFVGTPEQLADRLQEWLLRDAADGFNLLPPLMPSGLTEFARQVVPLLQERGIFRPAYTGTTLRDHYGIPAPTSGATA